MLLFFVLGIHIAKLRRSILKKGKEKSNLKDFEGSISEYTKAIELKPDYAKAYSSRGSSKNLLKDYNGSILNFAKAIELKPDFAGAYVFRGEAKINLKQKESACLDFSKASELGNETAYEMIKKHCK